MEFLELNSMKTKMENCVCVCLDGLNSRLVSRRIGELQDRAIEISPKNGENKEEGWTGPQSRVGPHEAATHMWWPQKEETEKGTGHSSEEIRQKPPQVSEPCRLWIQEPRRAWSRVETMETSPRITIANPGSQREWEHLGKSWKWEKNRLHRGTMTRLTDFAAETIEDRKLWNIKMLKLKTANKNSISSKIFKMKTFSINQNGENFSSAALHSENCESELVMLKGRL